MTMKKITRLFSLIIAVAALSAGADQPLSTPASTPAGGDPILAARLWLLAGNNVKAREILAAEITQGRDGDQKDVARLLYRTIPDSQRSRNSPRTSNTPASFDPGTPSSRGEPVQAEQAREKFMELVQAGKRVDAVDAFNAMAKAYPGQITPFDYYHAIGAASAAKLVKDVAGLVAQGDRQFPDDPVMKLADVLPFHWSNDAVQGVANMQKLEATATEPLLSMARAREVTFLSGDFDNHDRVAQAKKVVEEIIAAGQIDPAGTIQPMVSMLGSLEHRDGGAVWLAQTASGLHDPAVASEIASMALREYLRIGEADEARKWVESWKAAGADAKIVESLEKQIVAAAWTISGTVPPAMLAGGTAWRVTAVAPPASDPDGALVIDQSVPVGNDGVFSVPAPGASVAGLLLSGDGEGGHFIVKELGRGVKQGHTGNATYPDDVVLPPQAPAKEAPLAPDEFLLKYDFGIGEDFSNQLVELTVPKPAGFDPHKLVVKQEGTLAPDSPPTLPAQILEVGEKTVKVGVWRGLKQGEVVHIHVLFDGSAPPAVMAGKVTATPDNPGTVVDTGSARFRIIGSGRVTNPDLSAYVLGVQGPDKVWHGTPAWSGKDKPVMVTVKPGLTGPIRTSFLCHYEFSNGAKRDVTLSFDAGQPYILIDEDGTGDSPGEWHWTFKADEGFDQAFHACRPFHAVEPLVDRKPHFGASLRDYCYFNGGNGDSLFIGVTRKPDNAAGLRDAVTLFEVHPGDWTNPGNTNDLPLDDSPDAQWEHPERYCGSKNTMISTLVTKDNEMPFTIPVTAGIRRWGMAVTDQKQPDPVDDRDPHAVWALQRLLHTFGRGDLNRFLAMKLTWPVGPQGAIRDIIHKRLPQLASDIKSGLYAKAQADLVPMALLGSGNGNMVLLGVERKDPAMVWLGWRDAYSRLRGYGEGCLSIDTTQQGDKTVGCGDLLNMVGNRGFCPGLISYAIAEDAGIVTDAERDDIRRNAALLAYRYWDADTMNYHANAGQPNFEADRLLQLSAFPAMFPDHPDSDAIARNVAKYTAGMLMHWTIRDGGKWAENIGAYYHHSFNCTTMTVFNLQSLGLADEVTGSPYFEPFCRFAINTVQSPQPEDGAWLKKDEVAQDPGPFVRKSPGMGSHGGEGGKLISPNFPLMAQMIGKAQPKLAADLTALWQAGGESTGPGHEGSYGEYPTRFLLFGRPEYPQVKLELEPKRLPGWGMVMRDAVGTDKEFYLAFRAGTKAYRDVGNGSEFVMGALGKPLSLDGGDIGGVDQRSNLLIDPGNGSYWPVPMGPVTRWLISDAVEFARGEFQNDPADPNFYSRDVLFARNDYVLVHDEAKAVKDLPAIVNFCTPAVEVKTTPQGTLCKGKLGVDLWITRLADEQPPVTSAEMSYGDERVTLPNQWKQIAVRVPVGRAGTVLLYPVKSGGSAPQIKKLTEGVWQIRGDGFNDIYFDGPGSVDGGANGRIDFKGKMGLWRPSEGGRPASFSILNGDSVAVGGKSFKAADSTTFEFQGNTVRTITGNNQAK